MIRRVLPLYGSNSSSYRLITPYVATTNGKIIDWWLGNERENGADAGHFRSLLFVQIQ